MAPGKAKKRRVAVGKRGRPLRMYDSVQRLIIFKVEKDAMGVEKRWYQLVLGRDNLTQKQFEQLGKKYGLIKEAKIAYLFSKDPTIFKRDKDWFYYLQNWYIVMAEKELEARGRSEVIDDTFMRMYLEIRDNEIKNYAYKMRYYRYYRDANFKDEDLLKYVSAKDVKIIKAYINDLAESGAPVPDWFDAFQRLYIAVVKSLQKLRNYSKWLKKPFPVETNEPQSGGEIDRVDALKRYEAFLTDPEVDERVIRKTVAKINALLSRPKLEPPFVAPEHYMTRADKSESPKDFLQRVYGHCLRKGEEVLYQHQLTKLDWSLTNSLKNYCRVHKLKYADLVPPKQVYIERELQYQIEDQREMERIAAGFRRKKKVKIANKTIG